MLTIGDRTVSLEGQGIFLDIGDGWIINDDDRFNTRYFLFHRCNENSIPSLVGRNFSANDEESPYDTCTACRAPVPEYVVGYYNLCRAKYE